MKVENLGKSYGGVKALNGVSFNIRKGEIFGYLGPNGSGKTTTIRILATLIKPTSGSAEIAGYDVTKDPLRIRGLIGLVQQQICCEPYLKVFDNLWVYGYLRGLSKAEAKSRSKGLLEKFGLSEHADKKAIQLSLGLRRRLQIAREFIVDPLLLFLDEPTIGLDPEARRMSLEMIREHAEKGTTVMFTTHNMTEAEYLCGRITILKAGHIVACDTPTGLKAKTGERDLETAYLKIVKNSGDDF